MKFYRLFFAGFMIIPVLAVTLSCENQDYDLQNKEINTEVKVLERHDQTNQRGIGKDEDQNQGRQCHQVQLPVIFDFFYKGVHSLVGVRGF